MSGAGATLAESSGEAKLEPEGMLGTCIACAFVVGDGFFPASGTDEANCGEDAIPGSHQNTTRIWPGDEVSGKAGATG